MNQKLSFFEVLRLKLLFFGFDATRVHNFFYSKTLAHFSRFHIITLMTVHLSNFCRSKRNITEHNKKFKDMEYGLTASNHIPLNSIDFFIFVLNCRFHFVFLVL